MSKSSININFRGILKGHKDWVTRISVCSKSDKVILSSGRDKQLILWDVESQSSEDGYSTGQIIRSVLAHSEPISDCALSSGSRFALSSSWDKTIKLWDMENGSCVTRFIGHSKDVMSLAFSADECKIISGSRDQSIKLWNTKGDCKLTYTDDEAPKKHTDWVSCVRFSPNVTQQIFVSASWDKTIKVWDLKNAHVKFSLKAHNGPVHSLCISPDGALCASGDKFGVTNLWHIQKGRHLYSLVSDNSPINELAFSPCKYWLAVASDNSIKIWELENRDILADIHIKKVEETEEIMILDKTDKKAPTIVTLKDHVDIPKNLPWATCLAWNNTGNILYVGSSTGVIYVFDVTERE